MTPLLHPASGRRITQMSKNLPHAVLLSGQRGIGLLTIAKALAGTSLASVLEPQNTKQQPDEHGTITVERVRGLYETTRSKQTSQQVIIIDNAERMSHGAQSAFLKLLEEPTPHTHFLLTSHSPQALLPTIRSRAQPVPIHPITNAQSLEHLAALGVTEPAKKTQLLFIANGLPAELTRLVHDEAYFRVHAETIGDARDFLTGDRYKKLLVVHKYRTDRDQAIGLIDSVLQILRSSISVKPQSALVAQLDALLAVRERILANHNMSLQLTRLVM